MKYSFYEDVNLIVDGRFLNVLRCLRLRDEQPATSFDFFPLTFVVLWGRMKGSTSFLNPF
jgi:hypothetical protein